MDWQLIRMERNEQDPHGLEAFLRRLEQEIGGGPITGFTFLQDAREMLAFSRKIERATLLSEARAPLYVGFQTAAKLDGESERYGHLLEHGAVTLGFGTDFPATQVADDVSSWTSLRSDREMVENQWFLVTRGPEPIAFVGWEVSAADLWGKGGITSPGKQFAGFVSDDQRAVDALIKYLDGVRSDHSHRPVSNVTEAIGSSHPKVTMLIADDGRRPGLRRAFDAALSGAFGASKILLFDLSAASYLLNPYPNSEAEWRKPHTARMLRNALGRSYLADMVDELATKGIEAHAVLPEHVGFKHLAELSDALNVDLLVIPEEFTGPSLIDRLRGNSVNAIGRTRARVIVEGEAQVPVRQAVGAGSA